MSIFMKTVGLIALVLTAGIGAARAQLDGPEWNGGWGAVWNPPWNPSLAVPLEPSWGGWGPYNGWPPNWSPYWGSGPPWDASWRWGPGPPPNCRPVNVRVLEDQRWVVRKTWYCR